MPLINITSAWRRSTTGSGPSTSIACCSHGSTSATMSSGTDTLRPAECHPCCRSSLLPMFPVAHPEGSPGLARHRRWCPIAELLLEADTLKIGDASLEVGPGVGDRLIV